MNALFQGYKKDDTFVAISKKTGTKIKDNTTRKDFSLDDIRSKSEVKCIADTNNARIEVWKLKENIAVKKSSNTMAINANGNTSTMVTEDVNIIIDTQGEI